jgi:hypothetical protein
MMDLYPAQEPLCFVKQCESSSVLDTMKRRKKEFEARLTDVNNCIEALEKNPEITKVLELIQKAR